MEQNPDNILDPKKQELKNNTVSRDSFIDMMNNANNQVLQEEQNPFSKAKISSFSAGPIDSYQSFDRYYENPAFNRLGFNPYIDMENYYDQNTSNWESFKRTQKQWNKLFGLAWKSMTGGISAGSEADEYGEASRIGSTGNMLNDTYLNSGYTIGLMSEIAVEEVALAALTYLTEGVAGEIAVARTAQNVGRVGRAFQTVSKFGKNTSRTLDRLKDLKDVGKAKTFWQGIKNTGKAFNPLKGTTEFMKAARAGELKNISNLAKANKAFGSFYRDIREINLASNEADLEAGFVQNSVMDELYKEFEKKNGREPSPKELENIRNLANDSANSAYIANMGLIYTTNRLAFDGFFRKFSPKFGKTSINSKLGKIVHNKNFYKSGKQAFEVAEEGFKKNFKKRFSKAGLKESPLDTLKFLGKYTKVNFAEGIQEYGQEVIQHTDVQRAKDDFYGALRGGYYDYLTSSMDKFVSKEGLHVFMSGFLMGGMVGPYVKAQETILEQGGKLGKKVFQPGKYKEEQNYKAKREQYLKEQVEKLNEIANDPIKYFNMQSLGGLTDQVEGNHKTERYNEENKEKEFRDIEDITAGKAILSSLQSGNFDALVEQLESMSSLSEKELREAFNNTETKDVEEFKKNAENIIDRAKNIKKFYDEIENRFENPYDRTAEGLDTELATSEKQKWQAFENAKAFVVLNQYSFMRSLERMDSISKDFNSNLPFWKNRNIAASDINILLDGNSISKEVDLLKNEIDSLKSADSLNKEDKKSLKEKENKLKYLSSFKEKLDSYKGSLGSKELLKNIIEESNTIIGSTVKLKTKAGGEAKIIDETTTKGGKPAWKLDNGRTVLKDKVEVIGSTLENFEKDEVENSLKDLEKEYKKYIDYLAKSNDEYVDHDTMEKSFQKMIDFYTLNQDSKNLSSLVSQLLDPKGFDNTLARESAVLEKLWEDKKEDIKNDLESFYAKSEANELLSNIAKNHKAFILENDLEDLLEDNIIPEEFYDINSLKPIDTNSKRHNSIVKDIEEFLSKTGRVEEIKEESTEEVSENLDENITDNNLSTVKDNPVSIDIPLSEWPDEILENLKVMMEAYNTNISNRDDISDFAKNNAKINSLEEFIKSPIRKAQINKLINEYNKGLIQEEVKPTKQENLDTGVELEIEAGDTKETQSEVFQEVKSVDVDVTIPMSKEEINNLISNKARMVVLPIKRTSVEPVISKLVDNNILKPGEDLTNDKIGIDLNLHIKDSKGSDYVLNLVYMGKNSSSQEGGAYKVINSLNLPTESNDTYNYPFTLENTTYYAKDKSQAAWIQNEGKQHVFSVAFVQEHSPVNKDQAEKEFDNWKKETESKLNESKTPNELEAAHFKMVQENIDRDLEGLLTLTEKEMDKLLESAKLNLVNNMKASDFKVGEKFNMRGKMTKFGVAVVSDTTNDAVQFTSVESKSSEWINQKELSKMVSNKITDLSEAVSENLVDNITEDENKVIQENLESVKEFSKDKDSIARLQSISDNITHEQADDDFINNLGC